MSTVPSNRRRRRKRGVTRRIRDEKGNIIVRRYAKKQSRLRIPGLTVNKLPQLIIGLPFLFHSLGTYMYKEGKIQPGDPFYDWFDSFNNYEGLTRLLVTGTLGFVIPLLIGYPIVVKGFKIRGWAMAWRQLVVFWAISLVFLAIFSPFINEFDLIRQQDDSDFVVNNNDFDLSGLESPFYSELLNGLLDLLGNIPNPEEEVAYVFPADGDPGFDPTNDRYLYRWRVAETYSDELADFEQGFPNFRNDFPEAPFDFSPFANNVTQNRQLQIAEQYLTVSTTYSGEALVPWNSEYGSQVGSPTDLSIGAITGTNASIVDGTQSGYRDINEQPFYSMTIDEARTQGYLTYDAYFIQDDKEAIKEQSYLYSDLQDALDGWQTAANAGTRFGDLASEGNFESVWGEASLPDGAGYKNRPGGAAFKAKYDEFAAQINENTTIYDLVLSISNEIQSAILQAFADGDIAIDGTGEGTSLAGEGEDKAFYFFNALESDGQTLFGIEEAIAGFTNMLRAFNIPARPILGFSVGDFQNSDGSSCNNNCDQILIQFEHIHVWIEALIPRDTLGSDIFSWGIFNPIPDPHVLSQDATDFEFGRNSLGGAPDIELEVTSGQQTNFTGGPFDFGPFGTRDGVLRNQVGSDLEGRVRVLYDDAPSSGQTVHLKFINESQIFDSEVTTDIGIDLGSITTGTSPDGWTNFKFFVATNGSLYSYDGLDLVDQGITVGLMDPLATPGSLGVYAIIATYGLSFGGDVTGFSLNATFTIDADTVKEQIINPSNLQTVDAFGILKFSTVNFTVTVNEPGGGPPIPGVEGIELLMLSEADASSLYAQLLLNLWNNSFISSHAFNGGSTVSTTNSNGEGYLTVDFSQETFNTNEIYALVAVLQQGSLYSQAFAWYSDYLELSSVLKYDNATETIVVDDTVNYENGMFSSSAIDFLLDTNATGLNSGGDQSFSAQNATNVQLDYYILEESVYTTYVNGFAGDIAYANLQGGNIFNTCGNNGPTFVSTGCYDVTAGTLDGSLVQYINFTDGSATDASGMARVYIHLNATGFAIGYYYILVVAHDFNTLDSTVRFISTSAPALNLLSNNFGNIVGSISVETNNLPLTVQENLISIDNLFVTNRSEAL